MRNVTNKRLESGRGDILRVSRLALLNKWVPLGNWSTGPGLRCCVILSILHYVGQPLFVLLVRYENQLTALYRRLKQRNGGR